MSILHYIAGVTRPDTPSFLRQRTRTHPRAEYEQPAAITNWERPSNTAPWRPGYEKYGITGDPEPDNRFRAADLRPSAPSTSTPLAALTPTPVHLAEERQQHAAQQLAKARQKELAARRPGVVYKSRRFWSQFPAFDIPRHIFNGHGLAAVGPNLGNMARFHLSYMGYVENVHRFCPASIPPPPAGVTVVITDPNDSSRPPQYVSMDRRFAANFMTYGRATRAQVGAFLFETFQKAVQSPPKDHSALTSILFSSVASSLETAASWTAFFNAVPCNSATMRQMGENFLLASNMQPSLQAGGAPGSPLAAKESDTLQAEDLNTPPDGPELQRQVSEAQVAEAAGEGLPLRSEQLHSFRRVHYVDLNNMSTEFARLIGELDDTGQNVVHCSYGPTGVLNNGEPRYKTWVFWYRRPPLNIQAIVNADPQGKLRRDLRHVVPACPPTSRVAAALAGGRN